MTGPYRISEESLQDSYLWVEHHRSSSGRWLGEGNPLCVTAGLLFLPIGF